jgi:hypothetical protein
MIGGLVAAGNLHGFVEIIVGDSDRFVGCSDDRWACDYFYIRMGLWQWLRAVRMDCGLVVMSLWLQAVAVTGAHQKFT